MQAHTRPLPLTPVPDVSTVRPQWRQYAAGAWRPGVVVVLLYEQALHELPYRDAGIRAFSRALAGVCGRANARVSDPQLASHRCRVSCGWPLKSAVPRRARRVGECWLSQHFDRPHQPQSIHFRVFQDPIEVFQRWHTAGVPSSRVERRP